MENLIHTGKVAAHKRLHAEILLKADISKLGNNWLDRQISEAFGVSTLTVERVREQLGSGRLRISPKQGKACPR